MVWADGLGREPRLPRRRRVRTSPTSLLELARIPALAGVGPVDWDCGSTRFGEESQAVQHRPQNCPSAIGMLGQFSVRGHAASGAGGSKVPYVTVFITSSTRVA